MKEKRNLQPVLNALFVFEAAARAGSFTNAARELKMAQPSVSRFIGNLEHHIGCKLFDRRHNRINLTEAGEKLFRATELGLGHIATVFADLSEKNDHPRITISATHGFAHMWILPRLEALKEYLPNCDVQITSSDTASGGGGDQDLEVRFGNGDWPDVVVYPLFAEEVFPICAPDFLKAQGMGETELTPGDLQNVALLVQAKDNSDWLDWTSWFRCHEVEPAGLPGVYPVPSYHFILQAAAEGQGVALAWEHLVEPFRKNGWIVEVPNMRVSTGKGYFLTHARGHPYSGKIKEWVEQVR